MNSYESCVFFSESGLLKSRRKMYPPLPSDQNFLLPDFISRTVDSSRFLLSDQRDSRFGGRLLVFSSEIQMDLLLQADVLMADGTFRSCPRLFEQVYVIMAVKDTTGTVSALSLIIPTILYLIQLIQYCLL